MEHQERQHVFRKGRRQHGQGMSEYIIITALIAVAGIGIFAAFGDTIQSQAAAMAQEMAGQSGRDMVRDAATNATRASDHAQQNETLSNYDREN